MRKLAVCVLVVFLIGLFAPMTSAQTQTTQELQQEIEQLKAQVLQLQSSAGTVTGVTQPSGGGAFNLGNINVNWNQNNSSNGGVETGNASMNINTLFQVRYGSWNFSAPDANGYWNAQCNFSGVETPNVGGNVTGNGFGTSGNINMMGLQIGENTWDNVASYPAPSSSATWTNFGASLNAGHSLILDTNFSINENPDWTNSGITDFNGTLSVMGEKYTGVPINPQEPLEIQEMQSMITQLESQLPGGYGPSSPSDQSQNVPEPSTIALLAVGAFGLVIAYRRKRRS